MEKSTPLNHFFSPVSELHFGFLASSVINNLESDDYQIRRSSIKDLITTVQTTASSQIDVDHFLDYMIKFLDDENIIVAEKSCIVIESLCINLSGNIALYKNHLLKIAVSQLGSKKKFLSTFGQNILHIMMKSISVQKIVSDIFSMTLMSPPRTVTHLFNFITKEINDNTIQPSLLVKYAFIFEDSLNSDDNNLVKATQNCLQAIKYKDLVAYQTIAQRIKFPYSLSPSTINEIPIEGNENHAIRNRALFQNQVLYSTQSDFPRPFFSPNGHYAKVNHSFASHATFAFAENENVEIKKSSSANDSKAPTSRLNVVNHNNFDIPRLYGDYDENEGNDSNNIAINSQYSKSLSPKPRLLKLNSSNI